MRKLCISKINRPFGLILKGNIVRYSSTNNNSNTTSDETRLRILLKKFLFQVHPDYFLTYKDEQKVNENNVKALLALDIFNNNGNGNNNNHQYNENTRTLTFYVKASSITDHKPRRIKISIHRVEESIREVLETLGIDDLPPRPEGTQSSSAYVSANPVEVSSFLDTLIDRKEIMLWRQQRMLSFLKMKDILQDVLGVKSIDLRLSWSAQNNAYLMASLLRLIESERDSLYLPWTGLELIFTADDCTSQPIDYIEGQVKINPTHVPVQWSKVLQAVTKDVIHKTAIFKSEIMYMKETAEIVATDVLRRTMLDILNNTKQKDSKINNDELRMILEGLTVSISRGHTIDNKWYHHFLKTFIDIKRKNPLDDLLIENKNNNEVNNDNKSNSNSNSNIKETSLMVNPSHKFWLQQLPLKIELIIEHGHGTKLLNSGKLRVDCRAKEETIFQLIKEKGLDSISLIAEQKRRETMIHKMKEEIITSIGVQSIDAGIGISTPSMENCLIKIIEYIDKTKHGGKLRSLAGFRVKIGKVISLLSLSLSLL